MEILAKPTQPSTCTSCAPPIRAEALQTWVSTRQMAFNVSISGQQAVFRALQIRGKRPVASLSWLKDRSTDTGDWFQRKLDLCKYTVGSIWCACVSLPILLFWARETKSAGTHSGASSPQAPTLGPPPHRRPPRGLLPPRARCVKVPSTRKCLQI